jgi:hypothetical protein
MTTVEEVYELALARYGVVCGPQLGAVYATLPDADPQVAERVTSRPALVAIIEASRQLTHAEKMMGPRPEDLLRVTVYDPGCGVGIFLAAAARDLSHRYALRQTRRRRKADRIADEVLPDLILNCVYGMDTDPLAVGLARLTLSLHTNGRLAPDDLEQNIVCGDYRTGELPFLKQARTGYLIGPA